MLQIIRASKRKSLSTDIENILMYFQDCSLPLFTHMLIIQQTLSLLYLKQVIGLVGTVNLPVQVLIYSKIFFFLCDLSNSGFLFNVM